MNINESNGERAALRLFRDAARSTSAYRDFLKRAGVRPASVRSFKDFAAVPPTSKQNYLSRYPFLELVPNGVIPPMIYSSSGSSGHPRFWARGKEQERAGADLHENILRDVFGIAKRDPTLVVICYSMGVWVAGGFTLSALRAVAERGYRLSIVTPGMDQEDVYASVAGLVPFFKNVILVGYPSFLMDVVVALRKRGIGFGNARIGILTAGDKITEEWRADIQKFLGGRLFSPAVVSMYGSADAAALAHETPTTMFLRREAAARPEFRRALFGDEATLPSFMQYYPDHVFFENVQGEFLITARSGVPLIRYNIHDWGELVSYATMEALLARHHLLAAARRHGFAAWKLPFVILKGRTDVALTFYALNIFPEHLRLALDASRERAVITGSFSVWHTMLRKNTIERLSLAVEIRKGIRLSRRLAKKIAEDVVRELDRHNIEFRKLHSVIGKRAVPRTILIPFGGVVAVPAGSRGMIAIKNKKPRVII